MEYHKKDEAIFFVEMVATSPYCIKVPHIEYYRMPAVGRIVTLNDREKIIQTTNCEIEELFHKVGVTAENFTNRYCIYDMYNPFCLYFEINKIYYSLIEMANNVFYHYLYGNYVEARPEAARQYNTLIRELHLQDTQGEYCIKGYLSSEQSKSVDTRAPLEVFTFFDSLRNLPDTDKQLLLEAYGLSADDVKGKDFFFLNSPGFTSSALGIIDDAAALAYIGTDFDKLVYFYKSIVDYYFAEKTLVLKLHPASNDAHMRAFSEFQQIPAYIPSDLICLLSLESAAAYYFLTSSASDSFKRQGLHTVLLGGNIYKFFFIIHFVYAAFSMIKSLSPAPETIHVYGVPLDQLEYFRYYAFKAFKEVRFERLNGDNAKTAQYILADKPASDFQKIIKNVAANCVIFLNGDAPQTELAQRKMKYFLIDASNDAEKILKDFVFSVLSKDAKKLAPIANFTASWTLKTARMRVSVLPAELFVPAPKDAPSSEVSALKKQIETLNRRIRMESNYLKLLQLYYAAERAGYTLKDYFAERGLCDDKTKVAFFAVDEFGIIIYRIAESMGLKFSALLSDENRTITFQTHQNLTESLTLRSIADADKNAYTTVFMAIAWNAEYIELVKSHGKSLFLFDAVVQASYTRAFFINRIAAIRDRNPGVHVGLFFTPYLREIPGERSELEEFYHIQGVKMPNVLYINDETMREKAKTLAYREYGFDDEYIEGVCNAVYSMSKDVNGIYRLDDYKSKYANVIAGRRVTTDLPANYDNTVYFFGDSLVTSLHVGDSETIASAFQRALNEKDLPYSVQNCANSYGLHYDWIFTLADALTYKPGDILLFCARLDWLTQQFVKGGVRKYLNNIFSIDTTPLFKRPHDHGELFTDDHHFNAKGYAMIARKIFDEIEGFFVPPPPVIFNKTIARKDIVSADRVEIPELSAYLKKIATEKPVIGSVVMNCNPFTFGHKYLVEYASGKCDILYVFVVEEDRSAFPFADRIELARLGTSELGNVRVFGSGRFMISQATFPAYFDKEELKDVIIDASNDLEIFGREIAPTLGITVRFAGEEPFDNVTRQYNDAMRRILPQYGVAFEVIPRKKSGGEIISASKVRKLLETKDFDAIAKLVPETTLDYLTRAIRPR
jgi:[citrate (pro-3S)-lyase] ligase